MGSPPFFISPKLIGRTFWAHNVVDYVELRPLEIFGDEIFGDVRVEIA